MSEYVKLEGLSKTFGAKRAVNNLSFSVKKGEVLGFLGPNGAGKTTAMRMITGVIAPSEGDVKICGESVIDNRRAAARHIGYLPEGVPLYSELSPRAFLEFFGRVRGLSGKDLRKRLDYVREQLHLQDVFDQAIDTLSKGYKRRVGLAQAILHDPEILILDEPTDGLDPVQKHDVRLLIKKLAHEKAIVISTHILEEVESVCTRVIIVSRGTLLFDDTPAHFVARHPHAGAVLLRVRGPHVAGREEKMLAQREIRRVEIAVSVDGDAEYWVYPHHDGNNPVLALARVAQQENWELKGISVERGSADEVFRKLVGSVAEFGASGTA